VALRVDAPTLAVPPPRAYRRLRVVTPAGLAVSALVVIGLEAALFLSLEPLVRVFGAVTFRLVRLTGAGAWLGTDRFLGVELFPLVFGSIPPLSYQAVALWLAGSLAALALVWSAAWIVAPLRFLLAYNLALLSASALYLLFAGDLGYDAEAFSRLYLRTAVLIWLVTPVFMAALGLTLPFTALERGGLLVLTLAYDVGFSAVRYAVFVWLLTRCGAVVMASLYLFFGPLLDIIYFVGIFALLVRRLARRLARGETRFAW
jgi:hypothetical protein